MARNARVELRRVAKQVESLAEEVRGRPARVGLSRQLLQSKHCQLVDAVDGMTVLTNALGKLGDQRGVCGSLHFAGDAEAGHALHLRDDVQLAATFGEQDIDVTEQLKRRPETAFGL